MYKTTGNRVGVFIVLHLPISGEGETKLPGTFCSLGKLAPTIQEQCFEKISEVGG
jgi:hypothetical protein